MEKLKLSLSKQDNKMLKIKSEILKIRKNVKIIKLEKISGRFSGFRELRKFPIFRIPKIFRFRVVENSRKRETLILAVSRTFCRSAHGPVLLLFSNIGPLANRKSTIIEYPLNLFIFYDTLKRFNFAN